MASGPLPASGLLLANGSRVGVKEAAGRCVGDGVGVGRGSVAVGSGLGVGEGTMTAGVNVGKAGSGVSCGVLDAAGDDIVGVACEQATIKIGKSKKRVLIWFTVRPFCIRNVLRSKREA